MDENDPKETPMQIKSRRRFMSESLDRAFKTGIQFLLFYAGITSVEDITNLFELGTNGLDPVTALEFFVSGFVLSVVSSLVSGLRSSWYQHSMLAPPAR